MHWKFKAALQNAVSLLPSSVSYATYYWMQRHFGGLRVLDSVRRLTAGIETWKRIIELGYDPSERIFLEIGTGRVPLVPLAYWLMGAKNTITIDLNPYLKAELIKESLQYIEDNDKEIRRLFGNLLIESRIDQLIQFNRIDDFDIKDFFDLCRITYISPCDASRTGLKDNSVDFFTSYEVFEHINVELFDDIIREGGRILNSEGLFVNRIDYSDHFHYSDSGISSVNFLKFSDDEWRKYSENRYMYMNRLRHDDYISLFESAGHNILSIHLDVDQQAQDILKNGRLRLGDRFKAKSEYVLSIKGAWIVSQKRSAASGFT